MGYRVVVVGATGNVGREMLNILAEREFPVDEVAAVASPRSTGSIIDFGDSGRELKVRNIEHFDFADWDIALFAAGSEASKILSAVAAIKTAMAVCIQVQSGDKTNCKGGSNEIPADTNFKATSEVTSVTTTTGGRIVAQLASGICGTTTPTVTWDANVGETAVTWAITTTMADADCKAVKDSILKNTAS